MIKIIDTLQDEFRDTFVITDQDKNGKQYVNTRWIYPKDKERYRNVLIEIWYKPNKDRIDFVINRELLTPIENNEAVLDGNHRSGNTTRGLIERYSMTEKQLKDFVLEKLNKYCIN